MIIIDDETLKVYAYINISSYRVKTMKAMQNEVKTPTTIATDAGIRTNHISKVLAELKAVGVAECLNEDAKKNRRYQLTDLGEEIVKYMEKFQLITYFFLCKILKSMPWMWKCQNG